MSPNSEMNVLHLREQLVFADKAAVGTVFDIFAVQMFTGFNDAQVPSAFSRLFDRRLQFVTWNRGVESAVISMALRPNTSCAQSARYVESTPPE